MDDAPASYGEGGSYKDDDDVAQRLQERAAELE
jgi:hypothetical protein